MVEAFGADGVVAPLVGGTACDRTDFPGVAYAATAERAPKSATALPANQRVVREMRRRPASRLAAGNEPKVPPFCVGIRRVPGFQTRRRDFAAELAKKWQRSERKLSS